MYSTNVREAVHSGRSRCRPRFAHIVLQMSSASVPSTTGRAVSGVFLSAQTPVRGQRGHSNPFLNIVSDRLCVCSNNARRPQVAPVIGEGSHCNWSPWRTSPCTRLLRACGRTHPGNVYVTIIVAFFFCGQPEASCHACGSEGWQLRVH